LVGGDTSCKPIADKFSIHDWFTYGDPEKREYRLTPSFMVEKRK
jgi:hypothetical protein